MAVRVTDISEYGSWSPFFGLAEEVYRGDGCYLQPSREADLANLTRPELEPRQRALVAWDGDRPAARLVARRSPDLSDATGRPVGLLGFFEALHHPGAVAVLFDEAVAWLTERGAGSIVGPMDGDTWHRYRLSLGPFDERPFLLEPYNPPYYPELWQANGFRPLEDYHSLVVDDLEGAWSALEGRRREVLARGYRFESLRLDRFGDEIRRLYRLSCKIFRDNFLYSEISEQSFLALYSGFRPLVDPDLVVFARAPDGSDAGFLFAYPDRFDAVAAMGGERGWWARIRFLLARRRPVGAVNLKSLGVVADHRRSHLASALMAEGYRVALARGFERAHLCLIRDGNPSGGLDGGLGRMLRRYRLYHRPVGATEGTTSGTTGDPR